jgi:hypothetical protein
MTKWIPAFPQGSTPVHAEEDGDYGMSLRDYFAGRVMQSLAGRIHTSAANAERSPAEAFEVVAELSYLQADAMLKERDRD